jgi:hypothetical protein
MMDTSYPSMNDVCHVKPDTPRVVQVVERDWQQIACAALDP